MEMNELLKQSTEVRETPLSRLDFFVERCQKKKVLHIGCYDYPIFTPETNLHIQLAPHTRELHGLDILPNYDELMRLYHDDVYYIGYSIRPHEYDVVIAPEVLEHVDNAGLFLEEVFKFKAKEYIITAPNAYKDREYTRYENGMFYEFVHKDHKAWYSPYTLYKTVERFLPKRCTWNMFFLRKRGCIAIHIVK